MNLPLARIAGEGGTHRLGDGRVRGASPDALRAPSPISGLRPDPPSPAMRTRDKAPSSLPHLRRLFTQGEFLDLAGRGLGQRAEDDMFRRLVMREAVAAPGDDIGRIGGSSLLQRHES